MLHIILGFERLTVSVAKRRFCSKTVKIQFSDVETEKILNVVNNTELSELIDRFKITKTRARKLLLLREQSGGLRNIEQLLKTEGFGSKFLQKFCVDVLNDDGNQTSETEKVAKPTSRNRSYTFPVISPCLVSHINSFTSIHVGSTTLSWTTFHVVPCEVTKITEWLYVPLPEAKMNLYSLAAFMSKTLKLLPESDFYVFESPDMVQSTSKAATNVKVNQMIAMASVIAAERNTLPNVLDEGKESELLNVAYLRRFLYARLFKLNVGTERISTITRVTETMELPNDIEMGQYIGRTVNVDSSLKSMYFSADRWEQEILGCSFLLGLAFLRLSLLQCPISMKIVKQ